jgi:hypothetical protein
MIEIHRTELAGPPNLAERFVHVRALPWGDAQLAYELLVPKEFDGETELAPRETEPGEFQKIGTFRAPVALDSNDTIDVAITRVGRDVSLADFFEYLQERHGLQVLGLDALEYGDREAVDALTSWTPSGGRARISRFVLFRHFEMIARVSGTALADRYEPLAEPFAVTLSTFKFLVRKPAAFTEPFEWLSSEGSIPLGFRRPAAWRAVERKDVPWGRQVIEVMRAGSGCAEALLRAVAVDRDLAGEADLEALAREAAQELRSAGFEPRALVQRFKPKPMGGPFDEESVQHVYEGRAFGEPCEVRIVCLRSSRALYSVGLIAPAKEVDRFAWMGAKRAFEVALMSLNRPDEDLLKPPGLTKMHNAEQAQQPPRDFAPDGSDDDFDTAEDDDGNEE